MLDALWTAATCHRFLDAVRDGTIAAEAFDRWLVQDAIFVADLLSFQARLLARAPRAAQATLAGGCVSLVAELDWFEVQAAQRRIDLGEKVLPQTIAYRELLMRLEADTYESAVTGLWVLERVYLLAWSGAANTESPYGEFTAHWSDPGFAGYVEELAGLASPEGRGDVIRDVLTQEVAFWDMALA